MRPKPLTMFCILALIIILLIRNYEAPAESPCAYEAHRNMHQVNITKEDLNLKTLIKQISSRMKGREQLIPYIIHQTNEFDTVPLDMALAIETMIEQNPEYEFRYYNSSERQHIVGVHMGETALAVLNKILPKTFKADFFGYNILYLHGGCYFGSGTLPLEQLRDTINSKDTFVSSLVGEQLFINNNWICSTAKHPLLDLVIRRVIRRVANSEKGKHFFDITGSVVLTRCFLEHFKQKLPIK